MKKLTCSDLGGPSDCQEVFEAENFDELGAKSKNHVMEQMQKQDPAHMEVVENMRSASPEEQQQMFESYRKKFEEAPDA